MKPLRSIQPGEMRESCPCVSAEQDGLSINVHCWRPSCPQHEYAGVHVIGGDAELNTHIARALTEMDWYGKYTVSTEPYR